MALDITLPFKEALIQLFTLPDESANVFAFIKSHEDTRKALSDLTPSLG